MHGRPRDRHRGRPHRLRREAALDGRHIHALHPAHARAQPRAHRRDRGGHRPVHGALGSRAHERGQRAAGAVRAHAGHRGLVARLLPRRDRAGRRRLEGRRRDARPRDVHAVRDRRAHRAGRPLPGQLHRGQIPAEHRQGRGRTRRGALRAHAGAARGARARNRRRGAAARLLQGRDAGGRRRAGCIVERPARGGRHRHGRLRRPRRSGRRDAHRGGARAHAHRRGLLPASAGLPREQLHRRRIIRGGPHRGGRCGRSRRGFLARRQNRRLRGDAGRVEPRRHARVLRAHHGRRRGGLHPVPHEPVPLPGRLRRPCHLGCAVDGRRRAGRRHRGGVGVAHLQRLRHLGGRAHAAVRPFGLARRVEAAAQAHRARGSAAARRRRRARGAAGRRRGNRRGVRRVAGGVRGHARRERRPLPCT